MAKSGSLEKKIKRADSLIGGSIEGVGFKPFAHYDEDEVT